MLSEGVRECACVRVCVCVCVCVWEAKQEESDTKPPWQSSKVPFSAVALCDVCSPTSEATNLRHFGGGGEAAHPLGRG